MTAKFESFKSALHALCMKHAVKLTAIGYDDPEIAVCDADDDCVDDPELYDMTQGTPEEQAEAQQRRDRERIEEATRAEAEHQRRHKEAMERQAAQNEALRKRMEEVGWYQASIELAEADAQEQRKKDMRVSTDPQDAAYDPSPRRVWLNDVEVLGWSVADEFRRVVIVDGKARFGSVRIERLESGEGGNPLAATPTAPIHTGFVGVMEHTPDPKPEAPAAAPVEPAAPVSFAPVTHTPQIKAKNRR